MICGMSRREIAVSVLLGTLLLLLFAIPFILLVVDTGLFFRVLVPPAEQYFSGLGIPDGLWELVLFGAFLLWERLRPSDLKET